MSNTSHARLSPSSADTWMLCPGSVREGEKYEDTSSPAAISGTHTHTLIERCIDESLVCPTTKIGEVLMDHEGAFTVDEERAERAKVMIDYVRQRLADLGSDAKVRSETRVSPTRWTGRDDGDGTSDCVIIGNDVVEVIDYKDGYRYVDPASRQNHIYGCAVLAEYGSAYDNLPFNYVHLTIVQPNNRINGLDAIGTFITNPRELQDWMTLEYIPAANATDDPDAPLVAGEQQCQWCKAKSGCRTLFDAGMAKSGLSFPDLTEDAASKDPTGYSDEELLKMKEAWPLVKLMFDAVNEECERRVLQQHKMIPGLKVIRGRGSNKWAKESDEEVIEILRKCGVPKKYCTQEKVLSPAQAKKLSWPAKKAGQEIMKSLGKNQLKRLDEYIKHTEGALKIVLENDPGTPVELVEVSQFGAIATELPDWLKPKE